MILTIEQMLISRGEIGRIYKGETSLHLWRSLNKSSNMKNPLYPDFEKRVLPDGRERAADIDTVSINGILHVKAELGKGISLFDKEGTFGCDNWTYFIIPKGTVVPSGLIIVKDFYNKRYNATHYSISPNYIMPKSKFVKLLDELAFHAITRKEGIGNG